MDKQIKDFVMKCNISSKKEELINTKKKIFELEREMANLVLDYEVGTYVHLSENSEIEKTNKSLKKMEKNKNVLRYLECKKELMLISNTIGQYERSINSNFRKMFSDYIVPDIYVFQGYVDKNLASAKNIIMPEVNMLYRQEKSTIIYPVYDITSNRDLRHFYNRVSFKYLEAMSEDYTFDLANKKLGKVRIKNS